MDAAGACSASSKFAHASLLLSLWFILVEFSAQQLAMWLWEGTVPCAQWSKDRPGSQAMCKGFGQGPRRRQRSPVRVVASDSGSLLRSQHVILIFQSSQVTVLSYFADFEDEGQGEPTICQNQLWKKCLLCSHMGILIPELYWLLSNPQKPLPSGILEMNDASIKRTQQGAFEC